jgi:hypothetical protein
MWRFHFARQNNSIQAIHFMRAHVCGALWHSDASCPGTMRLADDGKDCKPEGHGRCCRLGQNALDLEGIRSWS